MNIRPVPLLSATVLVILTGCASQATTPPPDYAQGQNADDLLVVDCLLPGQVRKLGQSMAYLAPRRAVRTSAVDCEIRGGEYVAYDRANYATALKIWLPLAQQGDAAAQTYVGEIYEKGLGIQADYALAAEWYKKAARQGYSRARINLGYLYESGLGVPRDLTVAMNYYREASGLSDGKLEFVSSIEAAQREAAAERTAALEQQVTQLNAELLRTREAIEQRKIRLSASERELQNLQRQLDAQKHLSPVAAAPVAADTADRQALERQLADARSDQQRLIGKLAEQQLKVDELQQQLQRSETQLAVRRGELAGLQRTMDQTTRDLQQEKTRSASLVDQAEVARLEAQVAGLQATISDRQQQLESLETDSNRYRSQLASEQQASIAREQSLQAEIDKRGSEVVALQLALNERSQVLTDMESRLRASEKEQERLVAKLAQQQLSASELRRDLDATNLELEARKGELNSTRAELDRSRKSLQEYKTQEQRWDNAQVEEMENRIRQLDQTVNEQQRELSAVEEESDRQQSRLSGKLAQAELNERDLQRTLNEREQEVISLQAQLASAQREVAGEAGNEATIQELQQELAAREKEIAQQRQELSRLEADLERPAEPTQEVAFASFVAARNIGPAIEIIEPPVAVVRGKPSIPLLSEMSELNIIGRVSPVDGLMSFRINDQPRETDANGLFRVAVPVERPDTPIRAVAVDRDGRRASLDFVVIPKRGTAKQAPEPATETAPAPGAVDVEFGNYHALIIGNDNYTHMNNLHTARNDAEAVAQLLKTRYGFKTNLLLDADRYDILSTMNKLMQELTEEDNLLIYYAGHGELDNVNLRGYWLPVDAEPNSSTNWISNVQITDMLNVMSAKHVLVVADSCYSGSLTRSSVPRLQAGMTDSARHDWYKAMSSARARAVLTSGGEEPVLDSGGGDHSIFAQAFLEVLGENDGIMESYRLYREIQTRVKQRSSALRLEQDPQYAPLKYAGHEAGEFFFKPGRSALFDNSGISLAASGW